MHRAATPSRLHYERSRAVRFIARRRDLGTRTPGNIDEAAYIDGEPGLVAERFALDVPRGAPFFMRGWAVDLGRRDVPWDIRVELDGREIAADVRRGDERPDIVKFIGSPNVLRAGFHAAFNTRGLAVGPHEVAIRAVVGRRGTAFAKLPGATRFFIHDHVPRAFAPPPGLPAVRHFGLDPLAPVPIRSVLHLSGWALDHGERPPAEIAARLDDGEWYRGWFAAAPAARRTAAPSGGAALAAAEFRVRLRLDTVAPGTHRLQLAARTRGGGWFAVGDARALVVADEEAPRSPWLRPLLTGGDARITTVDGLPNPLGWTRHRVGAAGVRLEGVLRRTSAPGLPVVLIARQADGGERALPCWSTPSGEPNVRLFGVELRGGALARGTYALFVEAPDAVRRATGRAETGCVLHVG